MDNLNRTVSFILGLVVVIVFLAFVTGRLNLKNKLPILGGSQPSPTKSVTVIPTPTVVVAGNITPTNPVYHSYSSIPSTGSPTLLLPIMFLVLTGGIFLKRKI